MTTAQQVIDEVRRLARENPEFRYPTTGDGCYYVPQVYVPTDGEPPVVRLPACMFGQALANLGVHNLNEIEGNSIGEAMSYLGLNPTVFEHHWCTSVQGRQDTGTPWGECVRAADACYQEVP